MSLTSTIIVDPVANNVVFTGSTAAGSVETITYTASTNQITFSARSDISVSLLDFLEFISQVNVFNTAILFKFNPNIASTIPFGSCSNTENHDTGTNKWNLVCIYGATPRVCNYSFDISSGMVDLANRGNSKTIEFPEWVFFLQALNHYRLSIKGF